MSKFYTSKHTSIRCERDLALQINTILCKYITLRFKTKYTDVWNP